MSVSRRLFHVVAPVICAVTVLWPGAALAAPITGHLSTADTGALVAGGGWVSPPDANGFRIDWAVSQNLNGTWHYAYTFSDEAGSPLKGKTSHIILQLSENIEEDDLFNFTGDAGTLEFGTFGPHPSNPNFPTGESIFGVKVDMGGAQNYFEFDSNRQPMWGDFYAKDGKYGGLDTYAYNADLGVPVDNLHHYMDTPVDSLQNPLAKILVPDTHVPEPATVGLIGLGGLALVRRRR